MNLLELRNDLAQMKALRFLVGITATHAGDLDRDARLCELDERINLTETAIEMFSVRSDLPQPKARSTPPPPPPTTVEKGGMP